LNTAPGVRGADARSNPPPIIRSIERVNKITVLEVVISDRLSADENVAATITACKSLYALHVLRKHGRPLAGLCQHMLHKMYFGPLFCRIFYIAVHPSKSSGYTYIKNIKQIIQPVKDFTATSLMIPVFIQIHGCHIYKVWNDFCMK
jgi:hypothetical protein